MPLGDLRICPKFGTVAMVIVTKLTRLGSFPLLSLTEMNTLSRRRATERLSAVASSLAKHCELLGRWTGATSTVSGMAVTVMLC